jgi:hypothetical protein
VQITFYLNSQSYDKENTKNKTKILALEFWLFFGFGILIWDFS